MFMIDSVKAKVKKIISFHMFNKLIQRLIEGDMDVFRKILDTYRLQSLNRCSEFRIPHEKNVLIIAPHPDDEFIGLGGTILKLRENKCNIHIVYVTNGEPAERGLKRKEEAKVICESLFLNATFLDAPADAIKLTDCVIEKLSTIVKSLLPDIVFIPSFLDENDDHRRVSQLFYYVMKKAKNFQIEHFAFYQVYNSFFGNRTIDITDVASEKRKLINLYKSQVAKRDWAHYALSLNGVNTRFQHDRNNLLVKYCELVLLLSQAEYLNISQTVFSDLKPGFFKSKFYQRNLDLIYE